MLRLGHGEGHAVVAIADLRGLGGIRGFLLEVVGRYPEHFQALPLVTLVERLEPLELRGEATVAGSVDHHQRLAGVTLAKIDAFLGTQLGQLALQQFRAIGGPAAQRQPGERQDGQQHARFHGMAPWRRMSQLTLPRAYRHLSACAHAQFQQRQSATLPAPPGESQQRPGGEQPGQLHAAPPATCRRATGRSRTGQLSSAASRLSRIDNCQTRS